MPKSKTEAIPKKGMSRLFELAGTHKGLIVLSGVLAVLSSAASFVPYLAVYVLIRELIGVFPDFARLDAARVMSCGVLALIGVFATVLLYFAALALSHIAAYGTVYELKINFVAHISRLPLGFHIGTGSGGLRKIMDENIESVESFVAHKLPDMIAASTAPVIMLVMLFTVDWRYGLAALAGVLSAFMIQAVAYGGEKQKARMKEYQSTLEAMSVATVEYIRGIAVVKAFHQTVYSFKRLHDAITAYTRIVISYTLNWENAMSGYITLTNNIYLFLIPVGIFIAGGTADYAAFAGDFLFYLVFVPAIASILMKIMYTSSISMQVAGNVERMDEVLREKVIPVAEHPQRAYGQGVSAEYGVSRYDVSFENVSFSYSKKPEDSALDGVSFTAKQGETTAIVGPSGGGKSTIAHLIPRFYDVDKGVVKIGGVDIRDMAMADLMDTVSFVFQDTWIFKQSIMENIRMGKPGASDDEIVAAAKAARCHDFIESLPEGYGTVFGRRGVHLSGGEMQRVAIARALVKNAPILVLDEATAFSDPENEWLIREALGELMKGKTVIMIAHRLSTVTGAHKILVMDKGRLVEEGSHRELLAGKSRYHDLWDTYTETLRWRLGKGGTSHD
ncbi:MAG: ABC transporter ATP-binding protein/permease [Treponema sp.]|jgi:ATP-binding cassette subfamily B protein|nr:ABC transporter ATP-binding protein/permease [Treponema sp.]